MHLHLIRPATDRTKIFCYICVSYWVLTLLKHKLVLPLVNRLQSGTLIKPKGLRIYSAQVFGTRSVLALNEPYWGSVGGFPTPPFLPIRTCVMDVDRYVVCSFAFAGFWGIPLRQAIFSSFEVSDDPAWTSDPLVLVLPYLDVIFETGAADDVIAEEEDELMAGFLFAFVAEQVQLMVGVAPGKWLKHMCLNGGWLAVKVYIYMLTVKSNLNPFTQSYTPAFIFFHPPFSFIQISPNLLHALLSWAQFNYNIPYVSQIRDLQ